MKGTAITLLFALVTFSSKGLCSPSDDIQKARYIMHKVDWIALATISTLKNFEGYPFANLKSVSDGLHNNASGIPYLLMTDLDLSGADVKKNNTVTIMASLAETTDCSNKSLDPQDPRCGRLLISGKLIKLEEHTEEYTFANASLIERHPAMKTWVIVHDFYIAKISIENIILLDHLGGTVQINIDDYLKAKLTMDWDLKGANKISSVFNSI